METASPQRIERCLECHVPLPLRSVEPPERSLLWRCVACGAVYCGVVAENADPDLIRNVSRLDEVHS